MNDMNGKNQDMGDGLEVGIVNDGNSILNQNPDITLFKGSYKRHSRFANETIPVIPQMITPNDQNFIYEFDIEKVGDLLSKTYLQFEVDSIDSTVVSRYYHSFLGHRIIKRGRIEIDNVIVDQFDGDWLQVKYDLEQPAGKDLSYLRMVSHIDQNHLPVQGFNQLRCYVPLPFWFGKSFSQSLPLCCMKYSKIKIFIELAPFSELSNDGSGSFVQPPILQCDYIYLHEDERKKMIQQDMEYVIEQVQIEQFSIFGNQFRLYSGMERLIKSLIWVFKTNQSQTSEFYAMTDFEHFSLYLNGNKRFTERNSVYHNQIQPFQHYTKNPPQDKIFCYSFSLYPELLQPSGSCNFTVIEDKLFEIKLKQDFNGFVKFFGLSQNILRISGGKARLIFSY